VGFAGACVTRDSQVTATTAGILTSACQFYVVVRSSRKIIPLTSGFAGACVTRDSQVMATTARILTSSRQFA
jgi:hypothetical protein